MLAYSLLKKAQASKANKAQAQAQQHDQENFQYTSESQSQYQSQARASYPCQPSPTYQPATTTSINTRSPALQSAEQFYQPQFQPQPQRLFHQQQQQQQQQQQPAPRRCDACGRCASQELSRRSYKSGSENGSLVSPITAYPSYKYGRTEEEMYPETNGGDIYL